MESSMVNYGHPHPVVVLNEEQLISSHGSKVVLPYCSRCGEEGCGFLLHKECAEAPLELNHPFHPDHPLLLQFNGKMLCCEICQVNHDAGFVYTCSSCNLAIHVECASLPLELNHPFHPDHPLHLIQDSHGGYSCNFCGSSGKNFLYQCSRCRLKLHVICGMFTFDTAVNKLKELDHVALLDPFLHYAAYFSCDYGLCTTWVDLPLKLNHIRHREHPLLLRFNAEHHRCMICQVTHKNGLVYVCSPCCFAIHIECVLPPPTIQHRTHPHPFTLIPRRKPFTCDACGTEGIYDAYICSTCSIIVHKSCTSLPPIIKSMWHDHRIFHKYFLPHDFKSSDCIVCHEEVDPEHGSYCCLSCHVTFHVHCVTEDKGSYSIVLPEDEGEIPYGSSFTILETNDAGEATKIQHFKHKHRLMLSPFVGGYENSCDGCMLPVSDPFYYCLECDFFLHKACAELPRTKDLWHHRCRRRLTLISDSFFKCEKCRHISKAFAYECEECDERTCLRCVVALTPGAQTSSKHGHPLFFYRENKKVCNACGFTPREGAFRCKDCNFVLHHECFSLPIIARRICDDHLLKLAEHDYNDYPESHYCDICEERRDPKLWFYHCVTCDTSAHVKCVIGKYPFVKVESDIYARVDGHPHPVLTFVEKNYYHPACKKCDKPCEDLGLRCATSGCNYIVHAKCARRVERYRFLGSN